MFFELQVRLLFIMNAVLDFVYVCVWVGGHFISHTLKCNSNIRTHIHTHTYINTH